MSADHARAVIGDRICAATEGKHECDLDNRHVGHSRHMCTCGRYFDGDSA